MSKNKNKGKKSPFNRRKRPTVFYRRKPVGRVANALPRQQQRVQKKEIKSPRTIERQVKFGARRNGCQRATKFQAPRPYQRQIKFGVSRAILCKQRKPTPRYAKTLGSPYYDNTAPFTGLMPYVIKKRTTKQHMESFMDFLKPIQNFFEEEIRKYFKIENKVRAAISLLKIILDVSKIFKKHRKFVWEDAVCITLDLIAFLTEIFDISEVTNKVQKFVTDKVGEFLSYMFYEKKNGKKTQKEEEDDDSLFQYTQSTYLTMDATILLKDDVAFTKVYETLPPPEKEIWRKKWEEKNGQYNPTQSIAKELEKKKEMFEIIRKSDCEQEFKEISYRSLEQQVKEIYISKNCIELVERRNLLDAIYRELNLEKTNEPVYQEVMPAFVIALQEEPLRYFSAPEYQIRSFAETIAALERWQCFEARKFLLTHSRKTRKIPAADYVHPGQIGRLWYNNREVKINGFCFFKALAQSGLKIKVPENHELKVDKFNVYLTEGLFPPLEWFFAFLKAHTGINFEQRLHFVSESEEGILNYDFEGVDPTEASDVLKKLGARTTIHYGTWEGEFKEFKGRFNEATTEVITPKKKRNQLRSGRIELCYISSPFPHWMPITITDPKEQEMEGAGPQSTDGTGFFEKVDLSFLTENWKAIVSWILGLGTTLIAAKVVKCCKVDDVINRASVLSKSAHQLTGDIGKMEEFVKTKILHIETPEQKRIKQFLSYDDELNVYLSTPTYDFYKNPWKVSAFHTAVEQVRNIMSTLGQGMDDIKKILSGSHAAAAKYLQEIKQGLSQRKIRQVPTCVYFYGDPGVGKTEMVKQLCEQIKKEREYPENCVYSFKPAEHFDPYHQQPIAFLDEAFTKKDLTKDCVVDKFNALVSSDNVNLAGAAIAYKDAPCSWEYFFLASNALPTDIKDALPIQRDAVPAFFERMIIVHCTYNQGPQEIAKPREQRRRLPNCGHITFSRQRFTGGKFVEEEKDMDFAQLFRVIENQFQYHKKNFELLNSSQKMEGNARNHFVINLNGPPHRGKTETIENLANFFKLYDFPVYTATVGKPVNAPEGKPIFLKVDDCIKVDSKGMVDSQAESWYMDVFNSIPSNSVIAVGTNITLKKEKLPTLISGTIGAIKGVAAGGKILTCKIRKGPFANPGMYRRMGYCGYFKMEGAVEYMSHNIEFNVSDSGFKDQLTKEVFSNSGELYARIKNKYQEFLGIYRSFQVIRNQTPPPYVPDVTLYVNEHITTELSSPISLYKIMTPGGSSTGNKIQVSPKFLEVTESIPIQSLVPSFKVTYSEQGAIDIVKHFISIILPKTGAITIRLVAKDIGVVVSVDRNIYILDSSTNSSQIKLEKINVETNECTFLIEKEEISINIFEFANAMETNSIFTKYISLPTSFISYLREFVENIATTCPPIAQKLRERQKRNILNGIKKDVTEATLRVVNLCKEHPYWTAFIGLCVSLLTVVTLFKVFKTNKKESYQPAAKETMRFVHQLRGEFQMKELGLENRYEEMLETLKKMKEKEIREAISDIQEMESKKGKNKGRARFAPRSGKVYRTKNGTIVYTDEFGSILVEYHPIHDNITEVNKGRNWKEVYENAEEVQFEMNGNIFIETLAALEKTPDNADYPPIKQRPMEAYHPDFSPEEHKNPQDAIVDNLRRNGVYVFPIAGKGEVINADFTIHSPSMFGIGFKENYLIAPRHCILGREKEIYIADARTMPLDRQKGSRVRLYQAKHIYSFPQEELALFYVTSKEFPKFMDITPYVATPPTSTVTAEPVFISCANGSTKAGTATYIQRGIELLHNKEKYRVESAACVTYGNIDVAITGPGSCGLLYFLNNHHTSKILCGIHVASNAKNLEFEGNFNSTMQCLFTDHIAVFNTEIAKFETRQGKKIHQTEGTENKYWLHQQTNNFLLDASRMLEKKKATPLLPEPQSDRVRVRGVIKTDISKNFTTPYSPTNFSSLIEEIIPNTQKPTCYNLSKLTQEQKDSLVKDRMGVPSAAATQEHKWSDPLPEGEDQAFLDECAHDLAPYYSQFFHNYRKLTTDEVLNGVRDTRDPLTNIKPIETDSYAGLILERNYNIKKKSDLIYTKQDGTRIFVKTPENTDAINYVQEWVKQAEEALERGEQPIFVYKNCLKVEKLPVAKHHMGRTFTMGCLEGVLIERKYLAAYCIAHHRNPKSHNRLGISSPDFDYLFQRFQMLGGKGFSGDYSRFDRHQHRKIFETQLKIYRLAMEANGIDENTIQKFCLVMKNSYDSVHLTMNTIFTKKDGLNSGAYPTENLNSDNNLLYVYCGFKRLAMKQGLKQREIVELFFSKLFISCYGDDLLVGVATEITPWFNLKTLASYTGPVWGMKLDTADKDGKEYEIKNFDELPFISRTPKKVQTNNGILKYAGGLKIESISGLCHWTTSQSPEQIAMNLSIALTEAAVRGKEDYGQVVKVIKIAFGTVPGLSSLLTLVPRQSIIDQIYNASYGFPGDWQERNKSLTSYQFEGNFQFDDNVLTMGNCVPAASSDYVSQLNLLWQANRITNPMYCDNGTDCRLTFTVISTKKLVDVSSNEGTKRQRKQAAAKLGVEEYEKGEVRGNTMEGDNDAVGSAAQNFENLSISKPSSIKKTTKNQKQKPKPKQSELGNFAKKISKITSYEVSFPAMIYKGKKNFISVSFQFKNGHPDQYKKKRINEAFNAGVQILAEAGCAYVIQDLYPIRIYNPTNDLTLEKWQMHVSPIPSYLEMEADAPPSATPMPTPAKSAATPGTSDSGPIPDQIAGLPQQTSNEPSMALVGAGEIGSSSSMNCDIIELNPMTSNIEIPENTGRAFSIEEYLYEMWIPSGEVTFSSNSKKGDIMFTQSASPLTGLTPLHATYASLHKSAIFATESLYYIVSAQNVAAALIIGWVPDINQKSITLADVMATSWKIIDLNGNKVIKTVVRDARQSKFYRNLSDTDNVPGLVMMVLAPLNNMFATSSTFAITIQRYVRFSKECRFFNPVTSLEPAALTSDSSYFSPDRSSVAIPYSTFSNDPLSLFIGGNIIPQWKDTIAQDFYSNWFYPLSSEGLLPFISYAHNLSAIISGSSTKEIFTSPTVTQPFQMYVGGNKNPAINVASIEYHGDPTTEIVITTSEYSIVSLNMLVETTASQKLRQSIKLEAKDIVDRDLPNLRFNGVDGKNYDGKTIALQLDVPTVTDATPLAGDVKRFDFIVPGQSGLNKDVQGYYPLMNQGVFKLMDYLDRIPTRGSNTISFDISNQSGILASVSYIKGTGFFVNSPAANRVTARFSPSSIYLSNFGTADISSIPARDYSYMLDFVSPATSSWLEQRIINTNQDFPNSAYSKATQNMEAGMIAGAAAQAFSGLAGGIASGIGSYYSYQQWKQEMAQQNQQFYDQQKWQAQQNQGQWQNNLDNSNVQGSWSNKNVNDQGQWSNRNVNDQGRWSNRNVNDQGMWSNRNINDQGQWNQKIAQQNYDNSLRNSGITSAASVNAQGTSGASSRVSPRANPSAINVYNYWGNHAAAGQNGFTTQNNSPPSSSVPKSSFFSKGTQTSFNTKNTGVQSSPMSTSSATQTNSQRANASTNTSSPSSIKGRAVVNITNRQLKGTSNTPSSRGNFVNPPPHTVSNGFKYY